MSLSEDIRKEMFEARKSGDSVRSDILGMALASLKNAQIEKEGEMSSEDEVSVLRKEAKKLQDAIAQYTQSGNSQSAQKEQSQLDVLNKYLPQLMSVEDVDKIVASKISEIGAAGPADMGRAMKAVMEELKGKADGSVVSESVKRHLLN